MSSVIEISHAVVRFPVETALAARLRGRQPLSIAALDDVSFSAARGESIGVVGESGCGKSTLARVLVGLLPLTAGSVSVDGHEVAERRSKLMRRRVQMVFQDPSSSLNPARTVGQTLAELLRVHDLIGAAGVEARCRELLDLVHLPRTAMGLRPRELSGGQRQRVAIARALALEPEVLIADESVAALDVSVQALILNLLADLRAQLNLTLICISHDLAVVRQVSDRLLVMYLGRIVESGPADTVFSDPRHPYTQALMAAVPQMFERRVAGSPVLTGEAPSATGLAAGCRFRSRCPLAQEVCGRLDPPLAGEGSHLAACHFAWRDGVDAAGRPGPLTEAGAP